MRDRISVTFAEGGVEAESRRCDRAPRPGTHTLGSKGRRGQRGPSVSSWPLDRQRRVLAAEAGPPGPWPCSRAASAAITESGQPPQRPAIRRWVRAGRQSRGPSSDDGCCITCEVWGWHYFLAVASIGSTLTNLSSSCCHATRKDITLYLVEEVEHDTPASWWGCWTTPG